MKTDVHLHAAGANNSDPVSSYFRLRRVSPPPSNGYIPPCLVPILPSSFDAPILDIGCGYGQMLSAIRERGYLCLKGVDISSDAVDECRRRGLDVELIDDVGSFFQSSTQKYELIIMSHVLEHIEKQRIINILSELRRTILSPSGLLFVMVPNAQSNTGCYWRYEDFTHTTIFTSGSIRFVLEAAGFSKIQFLDIDGTAGNPLPVKIARRILLGLYRLRLWFWNRVTRSSFHVSSPDIFTYDLKVIAR